MANLAPTAVFDNVYQLETTDPVLAGAGGISNRQAQQLLNRTEYLKGLIDLIVASGGPFTYDASGGGVPSGGSGGAGTAGIKRRDQYKVTVAGTVGGVDLQVGDSLFAAQDAPTLISQYVIVQANVDLATASILGLVKLVQDVTGGANAQQTLSITGLLTLFAQLASPAFTGNPTVPTQAAGNSSTRIGSTAFIQSAIAAQTVRNQLYTKPFDYDDFAAGTSQLTSGDATDWPNAPSTNATDFFETMTSDDPDTHGIIWQRAICLQGTNAGKIYKRKTTAIFPVTVWGAWSVINNP